MRWAGRVARMRIMTNAYETLVENLKEGGLWETKSRLKDNIKIQLIKTGYYVVDWIYMSLGRS
jgi:hypothetical protein